MENPGLKRHTEFITVSYRRTATTMAAPTTNSTGYAGIPPEPETLRENVETGPPMASGTSMPMVSADNGLPPLDVNPRRAAVSQVPGATTDPSEAAEQRRITQQQQVGGGVQENPAYERAQQQIAEKVQQRRAHPLHQGAVSDEFHGEWDMAPFEGAMGNQEDPLNFSSGPSIHEVDPRSPQYDHDYERGWKASGEYSEDRSPLEEMDNANASHAAYDGYMDYAVGRRKYHLRAVRRLGLDEPNDLPDEHWDHPEHVASTNDVGLSPKNELCETCWLKHGEEIPQYMHSDEWDPYDHENPHVFKLFAKEPGQRYSSAPAGWGSIEADDEPAQVPGGGSVNSFGPLCENCWLDYGIKNPSPERHGVGSGYYFGHEFKPIDSGQRFSAAPASDDDEYWNGSDYQSAGQCRNCGSDDVDGVSGRSHCYNCGLTDSPRQEFGPLQTRDFSPWDQADLWEDHGKPGMEEAYPGSGKSILDDVQRGPGHITPVNMQRLNKAAAQVPNFEDPAYPYSGRVDPEDTTDLENMQSGDDTFRPHHPVVDRVMNEMQGLPDMTRNDPKLMEGVNSILDQYPDTEEGNRGADALSMGLNTIFDSANETKGLPPEERLQRAKDAMDAHFETAQLSHKEHVKQLHDDWEARGGHKTGEPRPVERFSPRYTKPQQIVPDPSNPFPELESPILYAGKCEGCGKKLYDSADSSGDPRGALGDHTVGTIDAAEYDATDVPKAERTGERRMHGPSALICPNCDNEQERRSAIEDKYLGHKAGDKTGDGYWDVPWGSPAGTKREFIPTTYGKDRKGKWHNPGEKVGSCPECDKGITGFHRRSGAVLQAEAAWSESLRAEAGLKDDFMDAFRDVRDYAADKPWGMGFPQIIRGDLGHSMKAVRNSGMYDEEGNVVKEPYQPPEVRKGLTWQDIRSKPRHVRQPTPQLQPRQVANPNRARTTMASAETEDEWWARQPDVVNGKYHINLADAAGEFYDDDAPEADPHASPSTWSDTDWDDLIPENMSLRDHARLLRHPGVTWDGDDRYPKYTVIHHREIKDSDGQKAYADEGHVIQHNTGNRGPVLPSADNPEPHVNSYLWSHTYYPAGQTDAEGLTRGYNTVDQALHATTQLGLFGARHPGSQALLKNGYRYVGNEMPYDPSQVLPHEAAMENRPATTQ